MENTSRTTRQFPIAKVPFEILSKIFALMNETNVFSPNFRSVSLSTIRDLDSIFQVSPHFRSVAFDNPHLWTSIPYLNDIDDDLVNIMLEKSSPLPFSLAFIEEGTLSTTHPIWGPVLNDLGRLGYLCIEVADPFQGTIAKFFLAMPAPTLQQCMVTFQGCQNEHLELDGTFYPYPFSHNTPNLQTPALTNCYIPPQLLHLPRLSCLSIRYFGPVAEQGPTVTLNHFGFASPQLTSLRHLVLWDCFSHRCFWDNLPGNPVVLPTLEQLTVTIPLTICEQLAGLLEYPAQCTVSVNIILPPTAGTTSADATVAAGSHFLLLGDNFEMCRVILVERYSPCIRLIRPGHQSHTTLRFLLAGVRFSISHTTNFLLRVVNYLALPLSLPDSPIGPFNTFGFQLWDALAVTLQPQLSQVTKFHTIFVQEEDFVWSVSPAYPLALFRCMFNVVWISIEPSTALTNRAFFHGAANAFPDT